MVAKLITYLMGKIRFGYWFVRALGQHLRLLLAYCGLDFEEVQYKAP